MKTIQKLTLGLLTVAAFSTSASAALEIDFATGAEHAGNIAGAAKFKGTGNLILSGVVSGNAELNAGNVQISAANKFGGTVTMTGGSLQATAAMTVPSLIMSSAATLTADAAVTVADSSTGALTLAGSGVATLAAMSSSGGIAAAAQKVKLNASSVLASATYNLSAVDIDVDAAISGNFATVVASGVVDATACNVAAGSFTSLSITGATGKLNIGAKRFSQDVTVLAPAVPTPTP